MSKNTKPTRTEGVIAYIPLTRGYEAVIDAADLLLVEGVNWYASVSGSTLYARRTDYSGGKSRVIYMHRVIMGEPDGFQVDHRDGDGLNNLRQNLRLATVAQNQHNQRLARDNSSGYKGVYLCNSAGKWRARIKMAGKNKHLGYYSSAEDAHAAYAAASAELHGEFGRPS